MMSKVSILLSTYNSELFIRDQIESILNQSYTDWKLLIRDDGSSDSTIQIVKSYKDDRIKILDTGQNIGIVSSFSKLLELDNSDYFFFCDHDDIWNLDKVEKQLTFLQRLENEKGTHTPILVHSDLILVDENNQMISSSMWKFGKIFPKRTQLNQILIQPTVTGCTIAGNKALATLIKPIPQNIFMHDWWASIIASSFGIIFSDSMQTIRYRIHKKNRLGMRKSSALNFLLNFRKNKFMDFFYGTFTQAEEMLKRFQDKLSDKDKKILEVYSTLLYKNRFVRVYLGLRHGFIRSTIYRNGLFYLVLFLESRKTKDHFKKNSNPIC